jgi:hypothetical protein
MTVLDAAPLIQPVDVRKYRLLGTTLIVGSVLFCIFFLVSVWLSDLVPSTTIYGIEAHWYYQCLVPAVIPAGVFFAYWIWLSSQYFRSHRDTSAWDKSD